MDSIYTRRVSAGECYPPDLVKSQLLQTQEFAGEKCSGSKTGCQQYICPAKAGRCSSAQTGKSPRTRTRADEQAGGKVHAGEQAGACSAGQCG